ARRAALRSMADEVLPRKYFLALRKPFFEQLIFRSKFIGTFFLSSKLSQKPITVYLKLSSLLAAGPTLASSAENTYQKQQHSADKSMCSLRLHLQRCLMELK
ncbi:MAG: hypothetical protein ACK56W_12000, partial [Pirellula sp.]